MPYAVGIDLGTTFTAAAVSDPDGSRMVSLAHDRVAIPSVVAPTDAGPLVGDEAATISATAPWNVAREFKRRFGDPTPMYIDGRPHAVEDLMSQLLEWVIGRVSEQEGGAPTDIVVTHPAGWGTYKQDLLRASAAAAGVDPVVLLPEPSAAAIHYHDRHRVGDGETIAVYDMGGGTFDVSLLERQGASYDIRAAGGLERAGGLDLDDAVFHLVLDAVRAHFDGLDSDDPDAQRAVARLREECTRAKIGLSYDTKVVVPVVLPGLVTEVLVQRSEFEDQISRLIDDTISATEATLAQASPDADPSRVLLVGGSSRVPLVTQRLTEAFGVPVVVDSHPKHAVALGAVGSLRIGATTDEISDRDAAADVASEVQELPTTTVRFEPAEIEAAMTQRLAIVLTGPMGGRVIDLPNGTTTLGRDDRSDDRGDTVGLGNRLVSRRHLSLDRRGIELSVSDLGSTNGTTIDGKAITAEPVSAGPGTIIDVAGTLLMIDGPGARIESVDSIVSSWTPPAPPAGGISRRLRRRGSIDDWVDTLAGLRPTLTEITTRLQTARRFERPSAAVLRAWSTHLSERLAPTTPHRGGVVIGWANLPSPVVPELPSTLSTKSRERAVELVGSLAELQWVPLVVPILGHTTVVAHAGPEADAMMRSMLADLEFVNPELTLNVRDDDQTSIVDIHVGIDPASTTRPASLGVGAAAEGRLLIGADPMAASKGDAIVSVTERGLVYRRGEVQYDFLPATLAD